MKLVNKCLAFCKENKIIVAALVVVLLSFVLLALPGQFAHFCPEDFNGAKTFKYNLNGYQFFFGTLKNRSGDKIVKPVAQGIAIFVMLILCVPGLLFSKKSSFVALLTSLALVIIAILFFTISVAGSKVYDPKNVEFAPANKDFGPQYSLYLWVPYLLGGLIIIVGGLMCYRTFLVMKDEVKHPTTSKGPTYSYLKK